MTKGGSVSSALPGCSLWTADWLGPVTRSYVLSASHLVSLQPDKNQVAL